MIRSEIEKQQGVREDVLERRQEKRSDIAEKKADRLQAHCDLLETRFTSLFDRIARRIQKLQTAGKDTNTAETAVAEAKANLASAQSLCRQAVEKFNSVPVDSWSTQQPVIIEAKDLAKRAREMFVKTHQAVAKALRTLAALQAVKPSPTASSSATPTPTL